MKVLEKKLNPLFGREEIIFEVNSKTAPTFVEVIDLLAKQIKQDAANIAVKEIKGGFGDKRFRVMARVYKSADAKADIEPKKKEKKEKKA